MLRTLEIRHYGPVCDVLERGLLVSGIIISFSHVVFKLSPGRREYLPDDVFHLNISTSASGTSTDLDDAFAPKDHQQNNRTSCNFNCTSKSHETLKPDVEKS